MAFACLNAGDFARFFAVLTDNTIATSFYWVGFEIVDGALPPFYLVAQPLDPENMMTILGIGGITRVADGTFTAVVVFVDPSSDDAVSALHLTLVMTGDKFKIDRVVDFHPAE
jgi:hypothetical protein